MTFGRFQPPTSGHEILFRAMATSAAAVQGDAMVFLSQTRNDKNPLSHRERAGIIRKSVPAVRIGPNSIQAPTEALTWAKDHGYTHVIFWMGGDRKDELSRLVRSWSGAVDPTGTMTIRIKPIPRTGEFAESVVGGSVARQYAQQGQLRLFQSLMMSKSRSVDDARALMHIIQRRLNPTRPIREHTMTMIPSFSSWLLSEAEGDEPTETGTETPATPAKRPVGDSRDEDRVHADTEDNQAQLVLHPSTKLKSTMAATAKRLRQQGAK